MFSQLADRHKYLNYDYQTGVEQQFDVFSHIFYNCIKNKMTRHGVIFFSALLIIPTNNI
jgi:translation initiation factor 2-alpha kinase 4